MKRCLNSCAVKEIQMKIKMKYHFISTGLAKSKRATKPIAGRDMGTRVLLYVVCSQCFQKATEQHLLKLKMHLPFNSGIPLLGIYLKETKVPICKVTCWGMFIVPLFVLAKEPLVRWPKRNLINMEMAD